MKDMDHDKAYVLVNLFRQELEAEDLDADEPSGEGLTPLKRSRSHVSLVSAKMPRLWTPDSKTKVGWKSPRASCQDGDAMKADTTKLELPSGGFGSESAGLAKPRPLEFDSAKGEHEDATDQEIMSALSMGLGCPGLGPKQSRRTLLRSWMATTTMMRRLAPKPAEIRCLGTSAGIMHPSF